MQYDDEEQQLLWDQAAHKEETTVASTADTPTEKEEKEVIHKIQYGDTLEGLSLEYSVHL
jgi:LysM repeat protein